MCKSKTREARIFLEKLQKLDAMIQNKIIEKGTDYIVDNYLGTSGDQDVKDYITKQLKSADVKILLLLHLLFSMEK